MDGIWGLAGWQWLFVIEAMPAIILGIVVYFHLTDRPEQAHWLNEPQRTWLSGRLAAERAQRCPLGQNQRELSATDGAAFRLGRYLPSDRFGLRHFLSGDPPRRARPILPCLEPLERSGKFDGGGNSLPDTRWRLFLPA
jgi:hypothetical protein